MDIDLLSAKPRSKPRSKPPKRNPLESVLSASMPNDMKRRVLGRAKLLDRPASALIRYAVEAQEQKAWEEVELARLSPTAALRLKAWIDSGAPLEDL